MDYPGEQDLLEVLWVASLMHLSVFLPPISRLVRWERTLLLPSPQYLDRLCLNPQTKIPITIRIDR